MKKTIYTETEINASAAKIWAVLTDFEAFPKWNPFIKYLKGEVKIGNTIEVRIEPPRGTGMTFKPKILEYQKNNKLRWLGKTFIPGLFDGEHCFELKENPTGTTTFIQKENFSGIFVGLFDTSKTKAGFEAMNMKIKELTENTI
jgi:hypothetical protein